MKLQSKEITKTIITPSMVYNFDNNAMSLADIGRVLKISRERARQLMLVQHNRTARSGLHYEKSLEAKKIKADEIKARIDDAYRKKIGLSIDELVARFGEYWRKRQSSYFSAKRMARKNKIDWRIRYIDWLETWDALEKSKTYDKSARYCFLRIDEDRPFEPGNHKLITLSEVSIATRAKHKKR